MQRDQHVVVEGTITINVAPSDDPRIDKILKLLQQSALREKATMATIQDVLTATSDQTTVVTSVVTAINALADQLDEALAANDPAAAQAAVDAIRANSDALGAAVEANTTPPPA